MLQHVQHLLPVTALAFLGNDDVILAGEGNYLQVYNGKTKETLASVPIFASQAIHGIIISPHHPALAVVWGGQWIRSCRILPDFDLILGPLLKTPDWVLDGSFASSGQQNGAEELIAFVTAHNALIIVHSESLETTIDSEYAVLPTVVPGSNCILYTAHAKWLSASQCLIASGTAFGDIIVWSANLSEGPHGQFHAASQVHYTFSAHEGSVFGVQISSAVAQLGAKRLLASCSDDRTVRIWDISCLAAQSPTSTDVQRDTGFGAKLEHEQDAPPCLAKAIGHVSRIWLVRFLYDDSASGQDTPMMRIMSFGEDASNYSWLLESPTDCEPSAVESPLRQLAGQTAHAGKHIWSAAVSVAGRIATGGCDGAIAVRARRSASNIVMQVEVPAVKDEDVVRSYQFVAEDSMIAVTDRGRVLEVCLLEDGRVVLSCVSGPRSELHRYSIASGVPGVVFMAGSTGIILVYDHRARTIKDFAQTGGKKVAGMFIAVDADDGSLSLLVNILGCRQARLFENLKLDQQETLPQPTQYKLLDLPPDFVITSFAQYRSRDHVMVALGSRQGIIALYKVIERELLELSLIFKAHDSESVTALQWSGGGFLHSVGRDGAHAVHRVTFMKALYQVETVHKLTLPFGPNIEGMSINAQKLTVWGFRGKQFVVHDAHSGRETMTVECGGAHRSFAFQPRESGGTFVWTKASKVYYQTQSQLPYEMVNSGLHGREVKSTAVSPHDSQIIATGAEDTNIKLSQFAETKDELRCLQTLRKHNTGIQHLKWSADGRRLFSSGGFEEFFVWRITFDVPNIGLGVFCESSHPRSGSSDLRIMGFTLVDEKGKDTAGGFGVAMAYSDSSVKLWRYHSKDWTLVTVGDYLTACLTHVICLDDRRPILLTTATDGHLTLWPLISGGPTSTWSARHKIHQNAVLSAASLALDSYCDVLITGGDDNAISITMIRQNEAKMNTLKIPRAHAAAVTGISVLQHGKERLLLASASIDQKIKVWDISFGTGTGKTTIAVQKLWSCHTSVADVSCLETYCYASGKIGLLVCGVGIELLRLQDDFE